MLWLLVLLALCQTACSENEEQQTGTGHSESSSGCRVCHNLELDEPHRLACSVCHQGDAQAADRDAAHRTLIVSPAHPDHAAQTCGTCHESEVSTVQENDHYTLNSHLNTVRSAFGYSEHRATPLALESNADPATEEALLDDLLRRRCLRCHVYYEGDDYPAVRRGLGCAACHMQVKTVAAGLHFITKPQGDTACLSCHYGNHVGFDYHGRFEHDLNQEYRTPYHAPNDIVPPYGVEYHQLESDIHFQAGMICIDCHDYQQVMGTGALPACTACHERESNDEQPLLSPTSESAQRIFVSQTTGLRLPIPPLKHPAHTTYQDKATCLACHAQWTFNDGITHLMRIDHDDLYDYSRLSVDGSSEVHKIISSHIDLNGEWLSPIMTDKFNGREVTGIWLRGFLERRWERFLLTRDDSGRITPARPIVELRLSWVDSDERVRFDNLQPLDGYPRVRPYAPHTTGAAGLFYEERLRRYEINELALPQEKLLK